MSVINAIKKGSKFNNHNHENGSAIMFSTICWCMDKLSDETEMTSIVVKMFSYCISTSSSNNYFKGLRTLNLGIRSGGTLNIRETRQIWTIIVSTVKYIFLVCSFLTPF